MGDQNKKEDNNMAVLAKHVDLAFVVQENMVPKFLNVKCDTKKMLERFCRLYEAALKEDISPEDPHMKYISDKIQELEDKLRE